MINDDSFQRSAPVCDSNEGIDPRTIYLPFEDPPQSITSSDNAVATEEMGNNEVDSDIRLNEVSNDNCDRNSDQLATELCTPNAMTAAYPVVLQYKSGPCNCTGDNCDRQSSSCPCAKSTSACEVCKCQCSRRITNFRKCIADCTEDDCIYKKMGLHCEFGDHNICAQCECGSECERDFRKRVRPRLYVSKSMLPDAGQGLFAGEDIRKDQFIGFYTGTIVPSKDLNPEAGGVDYTPGFIVDATTPGIGTQYFSNHVSLDDERLNLRLEHLMMRPTKQIAVFAKRDIKTGSELYRCYTSKRVEFNAHKKSIPSPRYALSTVHDHALQKFEVILLHSETSEVTGKERDAWPALIVQIKSRGKVNRIVVRWMKIDEKEDNQIELRPYGQNSEQRADCLMKQLGLFSTKVFV